MMMFVLIFAVVFGAPITAAAEAWTELGQHRSIQQTANNFAVQYVGQFQSVRSPLCTGPTPVLRAYCRDGTITVDSTSDPTITCGPLAQPIAGLDGVECTTSCTGTACNSVYLNSNTLPIAAGPFGEVTFTCTGASSTDVNALWRWIDSGDGNCQANLGDDGFNVNFARLGVVCPGSITPIFDDFYTECRMAISTDGTPGDEYTCFDGDVCQGEACIVYYQGIDIVTRSENFMDGCIAALSGLPITPAPTTGYIVKGVSITAQFAAVWGVLVTEGEEGLPSSSCTGGERNIRITCITPAARIAFVSASDASIVCTPMGTNVLECSDSSSDPNVFQNLVYECNSGAVPSTTVEYFPATASCSGNTNEAVVSHAVRLGPRCGSFGFFFIDTYTECGPDNQFQRIDGNYTCSSSVAFPPSSTTRESIPLVLMSTDNTLWRDYPVQDCITVVAAGTAPMAPGAAPTVPTQTAPTTIKPVAAPLGATAEPTILVTTTNPTDLPEPPTRAVSPPTLPTGSQPATPPTTTGSAPVIDPSNVLFMPPVNIAPIPDVEDGFTYSASYVGRFQYIRDTSCFGPTNPDIRIYCEGQVKLTGRSDKRITCNEILPDNEAYLDRTTGIQCLINCTDTECAEIFLTQDKAYGSLPFGQIYFQCSGNTLADITPLFLYAGNDLDEYGCSAVSNDNSTRNLHLAQLGVACPTLDGTGQEYVFDDFYFDCSGGTATEFVADFPTDSIACLEGRNCRGQDCEVEMGNNIVIGEPRNYQDRCAASVVEITPAPTPMVPNITEETVLVTSAIFQARWAVLMDSDESNSTMFDCFGGGNQIIRITCPNSEIELVNETFADTTVCAMTMPGVLECVDVGDAYLTEFSSVTYTCTGATLPSTSVEYPSTNAYCEGNDVAVRVRHAVEIGVFCGSIGEFYFGSFYYECQGVSPEFSIGFDPALNYTQYTCSQFAEFPVGSEKDMNQTIPFLSIGTGRDWLRDNDDTCFTLGPPGGTRVTASPTSAPITFPPTLSPTVSPTTLAPSDMPSLSPSAVPSILPSTVPSASSSQAPATTIVSAPTAASSVRSSANKLLVYGSTHGLAASLLCMTGLMAMLWTI